MEGAPQKKFTSPEEEIAFLRGEIAKREQELLVRSKELDRTDIETIGKEVVREYGEHEPKLILDTKHAIAGHELASSAEALSTSLDKVTEILDLADEKGIRNALTVLERLGDSFLTDEVHRVLVTKIRGGARVADLRVDAPLFKVLDMTLFEVALPEHAHEGEKAELSALMSAMEQFYAGMQTVGGGGKPSHYSLEIAVSDKSDDIIFYVAVPTEFVDLFEKQLLSLFPSAVLTLQQNDYNIFVEGGVSEISVAEQKKYHGYPLKLHKEFETDPLGVILNAFSKIEREGGGAAIQLVIEAGGKRYQPIYESIIQRMQGGAKADVAIRKSTLHGELFESMKDMFVSGKKKDDTSGIKEEADTPTIELFESKLATPILATNIRIAVSAQSAFRARQIQREIESGFHQFENTKGNQLMWKQLSGSGKSRELKAFSFREYLSARALPLSLREISTIIHFPALGVESSPQFKQSRAKTAPAPNEMPSHGTLLGINEYRGRNREVYITELDRMRHLYIIGQTGTGKSVFLKNLIAQDIRSGAGVCMIDPHGTDIDDVLASVPEERYDDVIYFDPSRTDMVMGLNMLEYDREHPEQKTFVVNELFSIFQKLYGDVPESMGPMFEQYFRNATLLVLEDPDSGCTLLDISKVMVDPVYRLAKLEKATNPVVVQFWRDIATKAGGEAALENIVPYITSKFDVFTANDYMRPIIGQQRSSFNFRELMDEKKILLVNLSKGRLGEINANLIGMIIVGKLLMAALSRVDDPTMGFPPFFLHIDEFQNVTTNSIASILSEARKYKLGLSVAHQFIAQLEDGIRDAVFGNVGSVAAFRVGPEDAEYLAHQFEPVFGANDLMNIENYHAYVRVLANGVPTKPFSIHMTPPPETDPRKILVLKEHSGEKYGKPKRMIDMDIASRYSH